MYNFKNEGQQLQFYCSIWRHISQPFWRVRKKEKFNSFPTTQTSNTFVKNQQIANTKTNRGSNSFHGKRQKQKKNNNKNITQTKQYWQLQLHHIMVICICVCCSTYTWTHTHTPMQYENCTLPSVNSVHSFYNKTTSCGGYKLCQIHISCHSTFAIVAAAVVVVILCTRKNLSCNFSRNTIILLDVVFVVVHLFMPQIHHRVWFFKKYYISTYFIYILCIQTDIHMYSLYIHI